MTERKTDHYQNVRLPFPSTHGGGRGDSKRQQQQKPYISPMSKRTPIESIAPTVTIEDKQLMQLVREHFQSLKLKISVRSIIAQGSFGTIIQAEWDDIPVIIKIEDALAVESDSYTLQQEFENYQMLGRDVFTRGRTVQDYAGIPLCLFYSEITTMVTPGGGGVSGLGSLARLQQQQESMARNGFVSDKIRVLSPEDARRLKDRMQPREIVKYRLLVLPKLGPNLTQVMRSYPNRRMPPRAVAKVAYQVLQHLEFMHAQGVVHRDIKPENLLIGDEDMQPFGAACLYLIDFGLSKRVWDAKTGRHIPQTPQDGLTGTLRYAGIHTHKRSEAARRDDLQALAYTLLYLVRGSLPWQTSNRDDPLVGQEQLARDNMSTRNFKQSGGGGAGGRGSRAGGGGSKRFGALQPAAGRSVAAMAEAKAVADAARAKSPQEQESLVYKIKLERSIESLIRLPPVQLTSLQVQQQQQSGKIGALGDDKSSQSSEEDTHILQAIGALLKYANDLEFSSMPAYKDLREMFVNALGGDLGAIDWSTLD
jgi:serine/threonine protein kinase